VDTDTGDYGEQRLEHSEGAEKFYRDLAAQGKKVRVGMEASGHARWFERLLAELNCELWIGDATEIARKRERKQKTDRQDAQHILQLLMENRFPSSGNRRRLGHITKQGSSMLRFLLVEAAQVTARSIPEWRSKYFHLAMRRGRKIAKVAMARRLAIALYWMWRKGWNYEQSRKFGSHAGKLGTGDGVQ
jgi:transposase